MKTLTCVTRIVAAAAAGILSSVLFSTVVSIAEPQRSALIAKHAAQPQAFAASAALRMADARRESAGRDHQP
jgi:predicted MFS family arabinose efflux permease